MMVSVVREKHFKQREIPDMKKSIKVVVLKNGKALMANDRKARVFRSKMAANAFVRNLNRVSKKTTLKSFEMVAV
jgi:hypothetical protein